MVKRIIISLAVCVALLAAAILWLLAEAERADHGLYG